MVRYLNFRMYAVEDLHYTVLISADNGADQLRGYMYRAADLHLYFHTCKKTIISIGLIRSMYTEITL